MLIKQLIPLYLRHLKTIGRTDRTVKNIQYDLGHLIRFLIEEEAFHHDDLTRDIIAEYQQDLAFRITSKGKLMSVRTQIQLLGSVKGFTRFLKQKDYLVDDPGQSLKLPRKPKHLPRLILNTQEVKQLLHAPDIHTNRGYRNRIVLEILYDTAMRRAELSDLKIGDIDLAGGYVHIHGGKGDKDRVVPVSYRVCDWIKKYVIAIRPTFLKFNKGQDESFLILNRWGHKMSGAAILNVVKRCLYLSKLDKNVSPHTFRHTCATHMLKNGAPIRHLQEMLGHESLESTQIYTRVTINDLKEVHAKYHPSENLLKG